MKLHTLHLDEEELRWLRHALERVLKETRNTWPFAWALSSLRDKIDRALMGVPPP